MFGIILALSGDFFQPDGCEIMTPRFALLPVFAALLLAACNPAETPGAEEPDQMNESAPAPLPDQQPLTE